MVCAPGVELWSWSSTCPTPSRASNFLCSSALIDCAEVPGFALTMNVPLSPESSANPNVEPPIETW